MRIFFFFILAVIFSSCSNDDNSTINNSLIGTWKLSEIYVEPGDGSGSFTPIESNKTVAFSENGVVTATNGNLCTIASTDENHTSFYTIQDNKAIISDCDEFIINNPVRFYVENGILYATGFGCIENCAEKYVRLN